MSVLKLAKVAMHPHDLEELLRRYEMIFSKMSDCILVVAATGLILQRNAAAERLFAADDPGQLTLNELRNDTVRELLFRVLSTGEEGEYSIVTKENEHLEVVSVSMSDLEESSFLIVIKDMTRLKRLEQVRKDFVANVSHELKTPITSIKGFVETLLDGAMHDPEDSERFLRIVSSQADRLTSIINDLLVLARLETDEDEGLLMLQSESVSEVVDGALSQCMSRAEEKQIRLLSTCDDALRIHVDRALFEQALVNLIDNAIKYSDSGKSVSVKAETSGERVYIDVIDEGPGIAEEHLPRLFERFYRVDKARSRKVGGTGLGLAIVKHIMATHGGSVRVMSRPGEGSTFRVSLARG